MKIILQGGFSSTDELRFALKNIQEAASCNSSLLNGDVIVLLKVDLILRKYMKEINCSGWNDKYFNGNLCGIWGENILDRTENYIEYLLTQGQGNIFEGGDYPLRNPKHVFDHMDVDLPSEIIDKINDILRSYIQYRKNKD